MVEATSRIVPGAPPPTPISKSQKKKRKSVKPKGPGEPNSPVVVQDSTAASLIEKAPGITDVKEGLVAPELTAIPSVSADDIPQSAVDDDAGYKPSPVVDLVHKRLKAIHKKIARITTYASTPQDNLNDDQKRSLKQLPSLEAVQKELEEVKKAIEVHESEQVQELTLKRTEAERAEKQRLGDALLAAQAHHTAKSSDLLSYLRLRASGQLPAATLDLDESENHVVFVTSEILFGDDSEHKHTILSGFLSGEGDYEGVPYTRLHEIVQLYLNPPRVPTPIPEEPAEVTQDLEASAISESETAVPGAPGALSTAGSFHFMQKSELEGSGLEGSVEWVERPDAADADEVPTQDEPTINNNAIVDEIPASTSGPIDWAEEEEGDNLPSIATLQAKFGTSGTATPAESTPPPASQSEGWSPVSPIVNGNGAPATQEDDDGFTQAGRGGRGRRGGDAFKQGIRGERGFSGRGGYRGRGDRGFRGGDRGFRGGGFRGDRGGPPRGGGDGDWRGEGRGRGRGRGGFHEAPRGAPPS